MILSPLKYLCTLSKISELYCVHLFLTVVVRGPACSLLRATLSSFLLLQSISLKINTCRVLPTLFLFFKIVLAIPASLHFCVHVQVRLDYLKNSLWAYTESIGQFGGDWLPVYWDFPTHKLSVSLHSLKFLTFHQYFVVFRIKILHIFWQIYIYFTFFNAIVNGSF